MPRPRLFFAPFWLRAWLLACALAASALSGPAAAAAPDRPKIAKPRPAPSGSGAMAPLPPAVLDDTLAIGGDEVNAHEVETRLSVDVRVNGRGPYSFIVDSGADTSALGLRIAHDLALPLGTPVVLNNMTDRNLVDRVHVDTLGVGPTLVENLELPVLREVDIGGAGMLGIDALKRQRLMLDFEQKVIKVEDASRPPKSLPGEIVVTAHLKRGQLILTEVKVGGLKLDAVVDTGSEITIGNTALRDKLIRRHTKLEKVTMIGVTGKSVQLLVGRIPELRLGSVTLTDVPMAFADVPPFDVFGLSDHPALLLGTDLLETFRRVSLDFRARKVRFQLRRCKMVVSINVTSSVPLTRLAAAPEACKR